MGYRPFEDLDVWKRACRLAVRTYEVLKDCRDFGLKDQMTRAAVSIASNIAEEAERDSRLEYFRFIHIAKGSAAELRTQAADLIAELKEISAILHGLAKSLKSLKT